MTAPFGCIEARTRRETWPLSSVRLCGLNLDLSIVACSHWVSPDSCPAEGALRLRSDKCPSRDSFEELHPNVALPLAPVACSGHEYMTRS